MKPEDNIEKFFEKRLQEAIPGDDSWNLPSDDIWEKAKVHFPKEEEKKRPLLYFWMGVTFAFIVMGFTYYGWNQSKANSNLLVIEKNERPVENNELSVIANTIIEPAKTTSNSFDKNEGATKEINNTQEQKDGKATGIISSRKPITTASNLSTKKGADLKVNKKVIKLYNASNQTAIVENNESEITKSEDVIDFQNVLPVIIKTEEEPIAFDRDLKTVEGLSSVNVNELALTERPFDFEFEKQKIKKGFSKWEVGLSYSPFLISEKMITEDESLKAGEVLEASLSHFNLNAVVSKRFNKRWSLSSGVMYSEIDIDLMFSGQEKYEAIESGGQLRQLLQNNFSGGSLFINDTSRDIDVELLDGVVLSSGNLIDINAAIPMELRAIQIPFILNYHLGNRNNRRLEGLLHAGFSVDVYQAAINSLEFKLYKEGDLISKPVDLEPINETDFGMSIFAGAGLKYHLNDHWNVGFSAKLDLTQVIFSKAEFGLYYRF